MSTQEAPPPTAPAGRATHGRSQRSLAMTLLRWTITALVCGALVAAARDAVRQLDGQRQEVRQRLRQIDARIERTEEGAARESLRQQRQRIARQEPSLSRVRWDYLALASGLYALALLPAARYWVEVLWKFGQPVPLVPGLAAHVLGQVGKYVPGKAMVVVLRAAAVRNHGARPAIAAIAVFVETLTMMASGATWAGLLVATLDTPPWIKLLAVALSLSAAIPTLPPLFRWVVARVLSRRGADAGSALPRTGTSAADAAAAPTGASIVASPAPSEVLAIDWRLIGRGWLWTSLGWLLMSLSFFAVVRATPGASESPATLGDFAVAAAAISLAVVAGFMSLLPGGAGVRELVLTTLLAPRIGIGPALTAAVLVRVVFLLVEALTCAAAWWYLHSGTHRLRRRFLHRGGSPPAQAEPPASPRLR